MHKEVSMSEIRINHPTDPVPEGTDTWTTEELTRDFTVEGFAAPFVVVRRKADGQRGSLQFTGGGGEPRVYHSFVPTS
jgi:hypothetical protein